MPTNGEGDSLLGESIGQSRKPQQVSKLTLHCEAEQNFSCHACGKCCTDKWHVNVAPEKMLEIKATRVHQSLEREGYVPIELVDGQYRLTRSEDGDCRYLGNRICEIHAEVGADGKPLSCQLFPFSFTNTPHGCFVSASFACPSILANKGHAVSEQLADLRRLVEGSEFLEAQTVASDGKVRLTQERELSWAEYLALEQQLLTSLKGDDPVGELLAAALLFATGSAEQLAVASAILNVFAVNTISVLECEHEPELRNQFAFEIQEGLAHSRLLSCQLPPFSIGGPEGPLVEETVARYMRSGILGKRLLSGSTVVTRILLLATAISILLYYLQLAGRKPKGYQDLEWAFDLIESNIFTHCEDLETTFLEFERMLLSLAD